MNLSLRNNRCYKTKYLLLLNIEKVIHALKSLSPPYGEYKPPFPSLLSKERNHDPIIPLAQFPRFHFLASLTNARLLNKWDNIQVLNHPQGTLLDVNWHNCADSGNGVARRGQSILFIILYVEVYPISGTVPHLHLNWQHCQKRWNLWTGGVGGCNDKESNVSWRELTISIIPRIVATNLGQLFVDRHDRSR